MYHVLVPVDTNEERARAQASYVSGLPGADEAVHAIVLYVFTGDEKGLVDADTRSPRRIRGVREAIKKLESEGVELTIIAGSGDVTDEIFAAANEHDVDQIVMGGRERSPAGTVLFGSISQAVIRGTDRPVVVTGAGSS